MADETTQAPGAKPADGLRDVPSDINEYNKFVKEGGLDHNAKVLGREAAVKAAKDAGVIPADGTDHEPHKRNGFQQRISRLQRKVGERDQMIKDLQARVAAGTAGPAPAANGAPAAAAKAPAAAAAQASAPPVNGKAPAAPADKTPPKPREADYKTYGEYIEDLTTWKTERALEARDAKRADEQRAQTDAQRGKEISDAHTARVTEAKERYPDWNESFKGLGDADFSDAMTVFIFESEVGADVNYYLNTHRDELARIAKLTPMRQAAALGKIEDTILAARPDKDADKDADKEPEEEEEPEPPKKKAAAAASKAPPPEKPIGGRGTAGDTMPDPADYVAYEAWSKRQAAKKKK